MATELERLSVRIEANTSQYSAGMKLLQRATSLAVDGAKYRLQGLDKQLRDTSKTASAMGTLSRQVFAPLLAALGAREVLQYAESWKAAGNALAVAGISGEHQAEVMQSLFDLAQKNASPLNATVALYAKAAQAAGTLGASEADILKATDAVGLSLKVAGVSAEEASGGLRQLGQLLSGGKVQAEEYNSLIDSMYPLLQAVASGSDKWGGSVARLTADVKRGTVTSREFFQALLAGFPTLQARADAAADTMSGAFQKIENALTKYIGETDSSLGVTQRLVDGLNALADNFENTADQALQLAAVVAGSLVGRSIGGMVTMLPIAIVSMRLLGVAATASAGAASFLARNFGTATTAIAGAAAASKAFRLAALGIMAGPIGMVIGGAVTALAMFVDEMIQAEGGAQDLDEKLTRLAQVQEELRDATGEAADKLEREKKALEDDAKAAVEAADKKVESLKKIRAAQQLYGEEGMFQLGLDPDIVAAQGEARTERRKASKLGVVLPDPTDEDTWKPTVTKPADDISGGGKKRDEFKEARDALIFEGQQLQRNAREQAIQNELRRAGKDITAAQAVEIRNLAAANYDLEQSQNALNEAMRGFGDLAHDALSSLILRGEEADKVLANLLDRLAEMVLQSALLGEGPLAGLMGTKATTSGGTGGLVGSLVTALASGGGKAAGGGVFPGMVYPVGERGRELFAPDVPGRIIPHDQVKRAEKLETVIRRRVTDSEIDLSPLRGRLGRMGGEGGRVGPNRLMSIGMQREATERLAPLDRLMPFGGMRAAGGPVDAGKAYLVGEKGEEHFVPRGAGSIVPNDRLSRHMPNLSVPEFNFPTLPRIVVPQAASAEQKVEFKVINNMPNAEVTQRETRGSNGGRSFEAIIDEKVSALASQPDSRLSRALRRQRSTVQTG